MITIVAFIINIGLFVKAKINLQNATDAAAYAGASVQARQLTKVAYLNWEMRNIYKEWLYKYYVIGNLNIADVENPDDAGETMRYKLASDINVLRPVGHPERVTADPFNIPTVCIHIAGSKTNICKRYSVPGLPEFGSSSLPGAEEASRAFMDTLISTKVNDCIDRTRLNMTVANTWTYNVLSNGMDDSLTGRGPAILSDRQGAWPKAVELAMRIRNLEYVMNRPAETGKICINGSADGTNCTKSITEIEQERKLGNERIVKAFYSGYRNLGNDQDVEMKQSFTLTEIPPKKVVYDNGANASALLIPTNRLPFEKQWVDLKLMMVNYAVFYAAMIPRADSATSGACDISKVAIPVPGYPLGFYKNPDVLTYYAVKGEATFTGMFNPFVEDSVKLEAYAAAKPMGGRIGPMLFTQRPNENYIIGRTDGSAKLRSIPYITSYDFNNVTIRSQTYSEASGGGFIPGLPLPTNSRQAPGSFWVEDPTRPVGGKLTDAGGVQFGVPNLVYDYEVDFMPTGYTLASENIFKIKAADPSSEQPVGLFSKNQFKKFRGTALSSTISPQTLDAEIARVRAPTLYEAANYMIPTPNREHNLKHRLDSFGFISSQDDPVTLENGIQTINAQIYAPLFKTNDQEDVLFTNWQEVLGSIIDYMKTQETGMTKYRMSMNRAAMSIWRQKNRVAGGATGSQAGYERAARGVSDLDDYGAAADVTQMPKSCDSLAGQFLYFYYGQNVDPSLAPPESPSCPTPLGVLLERYFSDGAQDSGYSPTFYSLKYSFNPGENNMKFMTAYMPGPFTGAKMDGTFVSPLSSNITDNMRRNSYSTKFITLDSLRAAGDGTYDSKTFTIHSEGDVNESGSRNTSQTTFANPLDSTEDLSSIKY